MSENKKDKTNNELNTNLKDEEGKPSKTTNSKKTEEKEEQKNRNS